MNISLRKYFLVVIIVVFLSVMFQYWLVGLSSLALFVPYIVYWIIHNETYSHRIDAFFIFVLNMVFTIMTFTAIYQMEGILCNGNLVKEAYESFYFSIVTWTTLGYGDCLPSEDIRHIAALEALYGYIMMAIFMSLLIVLLTSYKKPIHENKLDK